MKKFALFILILAMAALAMPVSAQTANDKQPYYGYEKVVIGSQTWMAPDYINLEAFPPLGGKLSERDARILQLHKEPLKTEGWYVNEIRGRRTFEVIWLDKGTMVWASNASGEPRYLASCGNRISFLLAHQITYMTSPVVEKTTEAAPIVSENSGGYTMPGWLRSLWHGLWNLFLFLLALALVAMLLALAFVLGRELYENLTGRSRDVQPQPQARPRPMGPRPIVEGPAPVPPPPAASFHRYGPYDHVMIDDEGTKGYRVTGVNGDTEIPLGTFKWAQTENASDQGEYVVVMV
ncbi:MAG: hypothetical protein A3J09_00365 [Candidatus Zambryskibacteria bacterium RIFCSPLOWO2_02_FULL_51_21]|uniref:Uncharacterized protein n=1 Tax=Candidatus Zambryskibacteria bacterium RIFCSPHIGHO2_02_FULL_43_37 TaxID=1802749 RepID=A0A1G2THZ4_9BACT|nr:MAG: hypothetical protein A2723_00365 [Candidatus Zambryskibacteria bacterium RIFCSPHIGHO2_01_FULL_52_18]OHA96907.1 MAG: hypothetical protein A3D49_02265 [Candidatus Zambryskibacteria bacterium RIFCSPHIGHO2_02_FULL_43_37]OHB07037.1 MAG: hypothetical protein A2944_02090 [Candidatus Zambryskibacteria bacterium RIFCSPLOWO2_01_FULL_52_12]OHB11019.1 MAG: hypothetical protein A3J09_00365 [Candidatus Zambryskibacteria bacterium RIFCSPLOWO2_02_FULL_51_21]